jgi:hypothetical protein
MAGVQELPGDACRADQANAGGAHRPQARPERHLVVAQRRGVGRAQALARIERADEDNLLDGGTPARPTTAATARATIGMWRRALFVGG